MNALKLKLIFNFNSPISSFDYHVKFMIVKYIYVSMIHENKRFYFFFF